MRNYFSAAKAVILSAVLLMAALPSQAADAIYPEWKDAIMSGAANSAPTSCDLRAILVDLADYTYSAAHDFLDDVPAAARVAVSAALTGKTVTAGALDTADFSWTAVTGDPAEGVILYCHTGVETTSPLILYLDTSLTGFPITPNGGAINFTVAGGGWFTL